MTRVYLNLTNGLDSLADGVVSLSDARFVMVRSTDCEQKAWSKIIEGLDADFLMSLAMGLDVEVHDYSAKKDVPRSIYQGFEFIRVACEFFWKGKRVKATVRGQDSTKYFASEVLRLSDRAKNRLLYFKRFSMCSTVKIGFYSGHTAHDGDYEHYARGVRAEVTPTEESEQPVFISAFVRGFVVEDKKK